MKSNIHTVCRCSTGWLVSTWYTDPNGSIQFQGKRYSMRDEVILPSESAALDLRSKRNHGLA